MLVESSIARYLETLKCLKKETLSENIQVSFPNVGSKQKMYTRNTMASSKFKSQVYPKHGSTTALLLYFHVSVKITFF